MNYFAYIFDGRVVELIPETVEIEGRDVPLSERYHPDFVAQLVPYDSANPPKEPEPPPPDLAVLKATLAAAATATRWDVETGGISLPDGTRIATAKADQDRITSVIVNAQMAGIESVDFKAESGWTTLDIGTLRHIATAVALHVQACFSAERSHHEAIARLQSIEAAQSYDVNVGWPA